VTHHVRAVVVTTLLVAAPGPAPGDEAGVARCGSAKVAAMARACGDLLAAEARFLRTADGAARDRRIDTARARVVAAWTAAEAEAGDARCAADTATAGAAVDRLAAAVAAARAATPPECGRTLVRLWRRSCRTVVATEGAALRAPGDTASERATTLARLRRRMDRRWPAPGCASGIGADEAVPIVLRLASGAAADATTRGMRTVAAEAGRAIGAAIEPDEVAADPAYAPALAHDSGSVTAENAMKWGPIHPEPDRWVFGPADAVVALAEAQGQRVRGHTLVWGAMQLPAYVQNAATADALRGYMRDHIAGLVGRYAGRIAQWDVVNEPLPGILDPPTSDGLDDNVFRRLLGPGYVAEALQHARAADPAARLYLNENGIEAPGPRQDRFYALVQELLAAGAPLDGVGFQAHVGLIPPGQYPDRAVIEASLRRFADLGLEVELTELDVTLVFRPGDLPARLAQQGDDYRAMVEACMAVAACRGITTWGLSDRYTWLRSFFGFDDWPLPFGDAWERKPAYFGMRAALLLHLLETA